MLNGQGVFLFVHNPFRYRGYYYDTETELYYLNSRYYNPEWGRFISADTVLGQTGGLLTHNLFAYCGNNPVMNHDPSGAIFDTILDVIFIVVDIVAQIANPCVENQVALAADVACLAIPFATGGGLIARGVSAAGKAIDTYNAVDKTVDTIKAVDKASDLKKATGSYEIIFKSGKNYVGKGGINRALQSAKRFGEDVISFAWQKAPNSRQAFIDEYFKQLKNGVNNPSTYNKIWSPGKRYLE